MNREGQYFEWLYAQIGSTNNPDPTRGYHLLAEQLHNKEFVWSVPNDDNRAMDGVLLREDFLDEHPGGPNDWIGRARDVDSWLAEPCSLLEMMIALAKRLSLETYVDGIINLTGDWFYKFLDNLNIRQFNDDFYDEEFAVEINHVLEVVINRTYSADGRGGLFPVKNPKKDFRNVELWYQMAEYVDEFFDG